MRKLLAVIVCAAAVVLTGGAIFADLPAPTEEEIEARLKEARKRTEAAQAEERALQKHLEEAKAEPRGQIKAEVEGVLCWRDESFGYYIRVRPKDDPKREIRVSLVVGEEKIKNKELSELRGKDITAKGVLLQKATGELYMDDFEYEKPRKAK